MCGISAVVALEAVSSTELTRDGYREQLDAAMWSSLDRIRYRGPDDQTVWISADNRVALGHARLAITDLSDAGAQPFHAPQQHVHAVINGEIFNYAELRQELQDQWEFQGHCDCEVIVPLYLKYGLDFLSKLNGEFAVILWDASRSIFLAARDRFGTKPLFWSVVDNRLMIASEAKAFTPLGLRPEADVLSIYEDGWMHDDRTTFKNVQKLLPSQVLTCHDFRNIDRNLWWHYSFPNKHDLEPRSEADMITSLRATLYQAVESRFSMGDVPVGIYLSGGLDSSTIAGMVQDIRIKRGLAPEGLLCFTLTFDDADYDETPIARNTAAHLGARHIIVHVNEDMIAEQLDAAESALEQPNGDLDHVALRILCQRARQEGVKVLLNGAGADDTLAGYKHYLPDYLLDLREKDSQVATEVLDHLGYSSIDEMAAQTTTGYDAAKCTEATDDATAARSLHGSYIRKMLWTIRSSSWPWAPWVYDQHGREPRIEHLRATMPDPETSARMRDWHKMHITAYIWMLSVLPNMDCMVLSDVPESRSVGLIGRMPFLDHRVVDLINSMPPDVKVRWDPVRRTLQEKYILRKAAEPFITRQVFDGKKKAFQAPIGYRVGGAIHRLVVPVVNKENLAMIGGYFDWKATSRLLERSFKDDPEATRTVIIIYGFIKTHQALQWAVKQDDI